MKIDYKELKLQLSSMSERSILFQLIKDEMKKRNHWKPLPRGKAFEKGNKYAKGIDK